MGEVREGWMVERTLRCVWFTVHTRPPRKKAMIALGILRVIDRFLSIDGQHARVCMCT